MEAAGHSWSAAIFKRLVRVRRWPSQALAVPRYQAHRGHWKSGSQENSISAFHQASALGAEMSELDVQLSSDGIPVVFHDENISRFSNENTLVSKLTAKELLEKVQAPSLEEVLRDPLGTSLYNIELKTKSKWSGELEKKVLSVVEMTNSQSRVLFSSFNPLSLYRLGRLTQRIPLALLVSNDLKEKYLREMWFAAVIPIHLLHLQAEMVLPEGELEYWLSRGVPVAVWTVNDPVNASQLLRRGALSIISDQIIRENK